MADWRKIIKDAVVATEVNNKKVKVKCTDRGSREEVYSIINSHYSELDINPKNVSGASSGSNFTMKFDSSVEAKAFKDTIDAIKKMDFSSGGNDSGTSGVSGSGIPGTSGVSGSVIPVIPVEEGSNKTTIYIVVGIVLLLAALVGVVIWKKRK